MVKAMMRIFGLSILLIALIGVSATAAPRDYLLDHYASRVGFAVPFGPDTITGEIPVAQSEISLDFRAPNNSRIVVVLDVSGARANFPFATQALRGPKVLAAEAHPTISFQSRDIEVASNDASRASLMGDITIRGVTRPVMFDVGMFRPAGQAQGERSRLIVRLNGEVSRAAFGADGWSDLVGDAVSLDLELFIDAAG